MGGVILSVFAIILGVLFVVLVIWLSATMLKLNEATEARDRFQQYWEFEKREHIKTLEARTDDQDELKKRLEVMVNQKREIASLESLIENRKKKCDKLIELQVRIAELNDLANPK